MENICQYCTCVFSTTQKHQRFCNRRCAGKSKTKKVWLKCQRKNCENHFWAWPCLVQSGKKKYCSRSCYDIAQRVQTEISRICTKCRQKKLLSEFTKKNKNSDVVECYCRDCRNNIRSQRDQTPQSRWKTAKRTAKRRGLDWGINFVDYKKTLVLPCEYCDGITGTTGSALDRKNNDLGYILDNIAPCCGRCNRIKSNYFTYEEMMELKPLLIKFRKNRLLVDRNVGQNY